MIQKEIEHRALIFTTIMNGLITIAGLWVFLTTGIQALFLDFFFSFIALISTLSAAKISKISQKKTKNFPNGLHFLEPLYSVFKTTLVVSLLVFSVFKTAGVTYVYFTTGEGEELNLTPVLPYTIIMFVLCTSVAIFNWTQNKKINRVSTMLQTEAKMNFIDGLQSLVIGIATLLLLLADINGPFGFLYYTGDFFVTAILVLITIKQPISEIINAFHEIVGATTKDKTINNFIRPIIKEKLGDQKYNCHIYKVGMFIRAEVILDYDIHETKWLNVQKKEIIKAVKARYENFNLYYVLNE